MSIGGMDRRITLQSVTKTQDALGAPKETFANFATVWAERMTPSGAETLKAGAMNAVSTAIFRVRHRNDITEQMRLLDGTAVYDIKAINPHTQRGTRMDIVAVRHIDL